VSEGFVRLEGVAKVYPGRAGDVTALTRVDLSVDEGQFVSLLGPSGCGKTTLLRLVSGLEQPSTGVVTVGGRPPAEARRAKQFGLVPQTPALLPWRTVTDNVRLLTQVNRGGGASTPLSAAQTDALLEEVGLASFRKAYPNELSGGMQQRVALVRAFALGAPVLLMDEPFAALDEITREEMRLLLLRLWEHTRATVLFVTHSVPEAAFLSDRVVVMASRPGRVVDDVPVALGRPRTRDLLDDPGFLDVVATLRKDLARGREAA
jgi:NitT/TauT family transport system ATP-binding protein